MSMDDYPELTQFLGAYLHQDFLEEFPTAADVVDAFINDEPPDSVQSAAAEIDRLLQDERFLRSPDSVLLDLGCYYDPTAEGWSILGWMRQVGRALRGS
jgi:hypothetical protein